MLTDIEIAQSATLKPISEIAAHIGLSPQEWEPYGHSVAKISLAAIEARQKAINAQTSTAKSKLILVTAINPTPAGEGKTTTTIGLGDGLNRIGKKAMIALREPSLGPCFGVKGGATGGGYAQVLPMERINLHLTGDFHAITAAHNLLAAMIDNHIYWGNELKIDPRRITWRRVMDMNDRALRAIVSSLGGPSNGSPREDGFDITVASEVMAVFCLATSLDDLQNRLSQIVIGTSLDKKRITAGDLKASGAMTALLKDALQPNVVQTIEGNPALIHGGPFANIAHGCNSVIATNAALALADYVVTEAGFGADLGAEKFLDIKCRKAGLAPAAIVVVATIRALKLHGGAALESLKQPNLNALTIGLASLKRHVENMRKFGVTPIVAMNHFLTDTEEEEQLVQDYCASIGVEAVRCQHWGQGSKGIETLAHKVVAIAEAANPQNFKPLYPDNLPLLDKINTIVREIYRGSGARFEGNAEKELAMLEKAGFGHLPVCIAKTPYSFTADPKILGAPVDHIIPIASIRLSAGAGFVVVLCGEINTMPGLPRNPAAAHIGVNAEGKIIGLS